MNLSKVKHDNGLESCLEALVMCKTKHIVKQCSSSTSIKVGGRSYYFPNSGEMIDAKYIKFITDTKNEVCANAAGKRFRDRNPKFIKFSPVFDGDFFHGYGEFCEIDINAAYWFAAYDYGLISEETYKMGFEVPKKVRLMALGSSASVKDVLHFDGENYEHKGIEFDENGRLAFFTIAKRIDDLMSLAMNEFLGACAFYWVDALFVKREFSECVTHFFAEHGFEVKVIRLAWIRGDAARGVVETQKIISETENFCEFQKKIYFRLKKNRKKTAKNISLR